MTSVAELSSRFFSFEKMYSEELREQTFEEWPFREDCNCTPDKMAQAGFVHCPNDNEPDVVSCFHCLLELDDWEPHDDPWFEHEKRSRDCFFLTTKKNLTELTVAEYYHLEKERLKVYLKKVSLLKMSHMRDGINKMLTNLKVQLDSV